MLCKMRFVQKVQYFIYSVNIFHLFSMKNYLEKEEKL